MLAEPKNRIPIFQKGLIFREKDGEQPTRTDHFFPTDQLSLKKLEYSFYTCQHDVLPLKGYIYYVNIDDWRAMMLGLRLNFKAGREAVHYRLDLGVRVDYS